MHPTDKGRKLDDKYEGPVDNFLYIFVKKITPILRKIGLTPNHVTFLSALSALISLYYFYKGEYKIAALFWLLNYFFDCVDGYMARKYDMITKVGDYFDHITDTISYWLLIFLFYKKRRYKEIIIIIIVTYSMVNFMYLQEKIYDKKDESETLNMNLINHILINQEKEENIKYLRLFSPGTLALIVTYMIYNSK